VDIPTDALDFALTINPLSAADLPQKCDKTPLEIGTAILSGATSVPTTCTVTNPKQPITGTAVNTRLAALDPGFNNGTIDATCNAQQKFTVDLQITGGATNPTVLVSQFKGTVLQSCTFTLAFTDAESSSLAGTIEVNGTVNGDTATFRSTKKIDLAFTANVYITSGTGAFSGYVGNGKFSQTQSLDMSSQLSFSSGGGSSNTPAPGTDARQAFCTANNISPCTDEKIGEFCTANPQACQAPAGIQSAKVRTTAVRTSASESRMTLTLKKGAGQVRITAPTPAVGKTKATVKSNTKITLAATPGATCKVTTNTGKTVGTAKANKSGKATVRPAANAYKGAGSVRATCTLNKKSFKSTALKITIK